MTASSPTPGQPHAHTRTGVWIILVALAVLLIAGFLWYAGAFAPRPRVAIVTGSTGPYWNLILKGAQDAADRHGVRLEVVQPANSDEPTQTKAIRALIGQGFDGVAVSPNDSARQARALGELAAETNLVTFDADSAISRRLCFVGTDNYDAGRMCGQRVREAIPGGGTVVISIGSVAKENGQRRRQGVIDELMERTFEPNRPMDPVDQPINGPKYTVIATLIDDLSPQRATELAVEAIKANPDLGCFVGLFASSTPAVLDALQRTGKLGQIKVVGFDANDETLTGIEQGYVDSSIVQDAYNIGYQAVRILADAAGGDPTAVPLFPTSYLECDVVTRDNLAEMRQAMSTRTKPGPRTKASATQPAPPAGPAPATSE